MDKRVWELNIWKEAIRMTIDAEAEAACQPQSLIKKIDNCCLPEYRLTKIEKPTKETNDSNKYGFQLHESKTLALSAWFQERYKLWEDLKEEEEEGPKE